MTPKKLLLLLSLAVLCWHPALCQQEPAKRRLSNTQKRLLKRIIKYNRVDGQRIGRAAIYSEQYIRFDSLQKISSREDIITFTRHRSPIIKAYAFNSLLDRKDVSTALQVLAANSQDTTVFIHIFGCIGGASTLGKYMFVNFNSLVKQKEISISSEQQEILDNIQRKVPNYSRERRIVARQIKDDE